MTTRCKFVCNEITKRRDWRDATKHLFSAKFSAVSDGSAENKAFFDATPNANLEVATYSEDRFEPGKQYYVDITLAE